MAFEAYAVAVKLSLINNVSTGLLAISSHFARAGKDVEDYQKRLNSIRLTMLGGGMALGAGAFGLSLFDGPLKEAIEFDKQINKFKLFGLGDKVTGEAVKFAKGMNVMGSSYVQNMKLMTEAQGVFRESGIGGSAALEGAKIATPYLAKIAFSTEALDGESAAKLRTSSMAMLRYVEDSGGLQSPQKFKELADAGWKMVQTSGGSVNWEQLRQFKARAGVAGLNLSTDAMAMLEPIITMLKGQTAGFSLRTAYNRLNGIIKIPNQVAHNLVDSGIWDASKVTWNSQGGIKGFNGNPLKDADLFSANPITYYEKYIMPMYAKRGITSDSAIAQSNAMLFGGTGGNMFTLIGNNLQKLYQSLDSQRKALGIDDSYDVAGKSAEGKMIDLATKWKNVLNELGTTVLPMGISGVIGFTDTLKVVIKFTDKFPTITKGLVDGFGALSAALAFGGTVTLLSGAFKGLSLALEFGGVGGVGGVGGAAGIRGIAAAIGTATTSGTLLFGLAGLGLAVGGMAVVLNALGGGKKTDPLNHPGMRWQSTGHSGYWVTDPTQSQEHAGMHFVRAGRGGYWSPNIDTVKTYPQRESNVINNTIVMPDGKVLANVVTKEQVKGLSKPQSGQSAFDITMSLPSVGVRFAK